MAPGHFANQIPCHVKVDLRRVQTDVAQVGREQGELRPKIRVRLVPAEQPEDGKGMTKVVQSRTTAPPVVVDTRHDEHLAEGLVEDLGSSGVVAIRAGEERIGRAATGDLAGHNVTVRTQAFGEIGGERHEARLAKLALADRDHAVDEVDVVVSEREHFTTPEAGQQKHPQGSGAHQPTGKGRAGGRQLLAGVQESACLRPRQHTDHRSETPNAEKPSRWYEGAGLLDQQEPSKLADHGEVMKAGAITQAGKILARHGLTEHGIVSGCEESVELMEKPLLSVVGEAQRALVRQKTLELKSKRACEGSHPRPSASESATERRPARSTWA